MVRRAEGLVRHQLVGEEAQGHRGVEEEEREAVEGVVSFPEVGAGALCVVGLVGFGFGDGVVDVGSSLNSRGCVYRLFVCVPGGATASTPGR